MLCQFMLEQVKRKLGENKIRPPILRRQIAGNWDNPYDLEDLGNLDIKLYIEDFFAHYGSNPPTDHLESIAIFPTTDNLSLVQQYLKTLPEHTNLSKL